jgi:hypothetical protein
MIQSISKGESSPQTSGIGKMFNRLKSLDLQVYNRVLEEYRPVFEMDRKRRGYGRKASKPVVEDEDEVAIEAAEIQREAAETEIDVPVDDDDVIIEPSEDEGDESPRKGKRGRPSKQPERAAGKVKPEPERGEGRCGQMSELAGDEVCQGDEVLDAAIATGAGTCLLKCSIHRFDPAVVFAHKKGVRHDICGGLSATKKGDPVDFRRSRRCRDGKGRTGDYGS